ncbi:hypothetical protein [Defluviitalea phaphyphila]|uniref:hypothetical protein n=1 Tax=Defluviitalea phaphyphila TaxID=1473580 RepID=UPI00072FD40B|nr:hypothetical protein [Defluviitalea phaphyphila]
MKKIIFLFICLLFFISSYNLINNNVENETLLENNEEISMTEDDQKSSIDNAEKQIINLHKLSLECSNDMQIDEFVSNENFIRLIKSGLTVDIKYSSEMFIITTDRFAQEIIDSMISDDYIYLLDEPEEVEINEQKWVRAAITTKIPNTDFKNIVSYFLVKDTDYYSISFYTLIEDYEKFLPEINEIINTVKIDISEDNDKENLTSQDIEKSLESKNDKKENSSKQVITMNTLSLECSKDFKPDENVTSINEDLMEVKKFVKDNLTLQIHHIAPENVSSETLDFAKGTVDIMIDSYYFKRLKETEEIEINGEKWAKEVVSSEHPNEEPYNLIMYFLVKNNDFYYVTFSVPIEDYENLLPEINEIMSTAKISVAKN